MELSDFMDVHAVVLRAMDENGISEALRNMLSSQFGECLCEEDFDRLVDIARVVVAAGFVAGAASDFGDAECSDSDDVPDEYISSVVSFQGGLC